MNQLRWIKNSSLGMIVKLPNEPLICHVINLFVQKFKFGQEALGQFTGIFISSINKSVI